MLPEGPQIFQFVKRIPVNQRGGMTTEDKIPELKAPKTGRRDSANENPL